MDILNEKKLAIFDMDGTLLDSAGFWNNIDSILIEQVTGVKPDGDLIYRMFLNLSFPEYYEYLRTQHGIGLSDDEIQEKQIHIANEFYRGVDLKPNADVFLKKLKTNGMIVTLATDCLPDLIDVVKDENQKVITQADFREIFDVIVTNRDVKEKKPDPAKFNFIINKYSIDPADVVIFEDNLAGIQAAASTGATVVHVQDPCADGDMDNIRELCTVSIGNYAELL